MLQISKRLARRFQSEPGYRAVLTRDDDRFIPLKHRPRIAREAGADFFLSIHADSFPKNKRVRGTGVYALSLRGANSIVTGGCRIPRMLKIWRVGSIWVMSTTLRARYCLICRWNPPLESLSRLEKFVLSDLTDMGRVHKKQLGLANFAVLRSGYSLSAN